MDLLALVLKFHGQNAIFGQQRKKPEEKTERRDFERTEKEKEEEKLEPFREKIEENMNLWVLEFFYFILAHPVYKM